MRVSIQLQITDDHGIISASEEVAAFEKATERPEDLGLLISEGKTLLAAVQRETVSAQVTGWLDQHRGCDACGERRQVKGSYPIKFHTLYGDVELRSPRLHRCSCRGTDGPASVSPLRDLIPDHVAPERLYLEARRGILSVPFWALGCLVPGFRCIQAALILSLAHAVH